MAMRDPIGELVAEARGDRSWLLVAVLVVATAHAVGGVAAVRLRLGVATHFEQPPTEVVELDIPKPPPPPPTGPTQQPLESKAPAPPKAAAPPPPPAQAAAVLTKAPDPNDPLDLTGDGFVVGSVDTYAGGQTSSNGTNTHAVAGPSSLGPSAQRAAAPPVASTTTEPDRSRRASVAGDSQWQCPFPPEADADLVDNAVVTIRVDVDPSGSVHGVAVLTDPGHGFGREAQRCAVSKHWNPALDRSGSPIEGTVTIRVRFDR